MVNPGPLTLQPWRGPPWREGSESATGMEVEVLSEGKRGITGGLPPRVELMNWMLQIMMTEQIQVNMGTAYCLIAQSHRLRAH
jgi:hypothetical protein